VVRLWLPSKVIRTLNQKKRSAVKQKRRKKRKKRTNEFNDRSFFIHGKSNVKFILEYSTVA
jgi:hypothetical protein